MNALSPDGRLRAEHDVLYDDRCGPWETLRLVDVASEQELLHYTNNGCNAELVFRDGGEVDLQLNDRQGVRRLVRVDLVKRCFRLPPDERPFELHQLQQRLGLEDPVAARLPPPPVHPRMARALALFSLLGSLGFVAGGLWMAIEGHSARDRWAGLAGIAFFGASAVSFWSDWRQNS